MTTADPVAALRAHERISAAVLRRGAGGARVPLARLAPSIIAQLDFPAGTFAAFTVPFDFAEACPAAEPEPANIQLEPETDPDSDSDPETEPATELKANTETKSKSKSKVKAKVKSKSKSKSKSRSKAKSKPKKGGDLAAAML